MQPLTQWVAAQGRPRKTTAAQRLNTSLDQLRRWCAAGAMIDEDMVVWIRSPMKPKKIKNKSTK